MIRIVEPLIVLSIFLVYINRVELSINYILQTVLDCDLFTLPVSLSLTLLLLISISVCSERVVDLEEMESEIMRGKS